MGARSASGTVTISDAHTYGIDEMSLMNQVNDFLGISTNAAALLHEFPPLDKDTTASNAFYLNVVTRVFTTSKVAVSIYNDSSVGGGVSAGSVNASIAQFTGTNAASNYSNLVTAVNGLGNSGLTNVGGALKFTSMSSRSVALNETFPKPLIIGYLAFSVPITYQDIYFNAYGTEYSLTNALGKSMQLSFIKQAQPTVANAVQKKSFFKVPFDPNKRQHYSN